MKAKDLIKLLRDDPDVQNAVVETVLKALLRMTPEERLKFAATLLPEIQDVDWEKIKSLLPKKSRAPGKKPSWKECLDVLDKMTGMKK